LFKKGAAFFIDYYFHGDKMVKITEIQIRANDNSIRSLADVNISPSTALCELINNSIQAAEDKDVDSIIHIDYEFDDDNKSMLRSFCIRDESGGIERNNIQAALTPGYRTSKKLTLSEHGLGLNVALEFLTKDNGTFKLVSHLDNGSYMINEQVSYEHPTTLYDHDPKEKPNGLEVVITNPSLDDLSYPQRADSKGFKFWMECCAKYRFKHSAFIDRGRRFEIIFSYRCGDRFSTRRFSPVGHVLKNPIAGDASWLTRFELQDEDMKVQFNLGVAETNKDKYRYELANRNLINRSMHPYHGSDAIGFETIYKDVVITRPSLKTLGIGKSLVGGNYALLSLLRGEMIILEGGKSVFTKDGVQRSEKLTRIKDRAVAIFNGKEPHPHTGKEVNYMKDYVHSTNYSKGDVPKEDIIKYRHREILESIGLTVRQEETNAYGIVDMVVDNKVLEHKREQSTTSDVLQIIKYMVALHGKSQIEGYQLWAPSHSDKARIFLSELKENIFKEGLPTIELKKLTPSILNPNVTEEERLAVAKKK
jgi:hypothetical protein